MSMFNYFPYIQYNNTKATHLLLSERVINRFTNDLSKFYYYTVKEGERADVIAYDQYNDASLDWVIYLVNGVVDPIKDWVMDDKQFRNYLEGKYNCAVERLTTTLVESSIDHYYYKGIATDSQEEINSYNYTMSPYTYNELGMPAGWVAKTIYDVEYENLSLIHI